MASPIVAATAALILSVNPDLSVQEVKDILYSSAVDLGSSGRDDYYGYGRVNSQAAVLAARNTVLSQGSGTSSNPYLIYTPRQLNSIRYFPSAHFRLMNDIDLGALMHDGTDFYNGGKGWEPIPMLSESLDGDGYSINGLLCNRPGEAEVGLFERIDEDAVVENLNMNGHDIVGSDHAGAIAAFNYGTIQNCHTDGSVHSYGYQTAGGIAGYNGYQILNCSNAGSVYGGGGIVGDNDQKTLIDHCINTADITNGAGILGMNFVGTISNCANFGTILGSNQQTGGIVAFDAHGIYENCYNAGTISTSSAQDTIGVGGIVGYAYYTSITNCFNVGKSYEPDFGSIAGYINSDAIIDNCYNANYQTHNIFYEFVVGHTISNSYFLYDGNENLGPMAKTSAELKMQSTYETYNFSSIWSIVEGERFAVLQGLPFTYMTDFSLEQETIDVFTGQEETLTPVFVPSDATNKSILWISDNESVAEVSDGVVTGISSGTAVITAITADGTFVDTCTVYVQQVATNVWIDKETLSLILGTQGQLNATVWPSDAYNKNVTWACEDESIATVNQEGVVSAVSQGTTAVTVTTQQGSLIDSCTVYVTLTSTAVEGIEISSNSEGIGIGDEVRLGYTISPANATNSDVTWSSGDESIAVVDNGIVTSTGVGSVTITVTTQEGGYTDICTVTVKSATLESTVYTVGADGTLNGVRIDTTTAQLIANLVNDSADIKIYDQNGNEVTGGILCTGMTVKLIIDGTVRDELTIVILGDANGDGLIRITDYTLVRLDILGLKALSGVFMEASDIDGDGVIRITDYTLIRLDILGLKSIH